LISQVRNETGATLTKGTVVYISGAAGNKAVVSKALATGDSTSAQTYGMVQADIPHNQNGYVVVVGAVSGLNTSAFADGTQLYLSGVSAGGYTNTKPYAPTHLVYVGIVTYSHNTQGTIQVKIQNGYELDEIHDVSARSPVDGQTLVYVSSTGLWTKTDQASMSVGSAATLATARNINGVSFNGSADITVADATKLPLTGGTLTGKLTLDGRNEVYGVPTNAGTIAGFMGGTSGGTTAARTQSLNTQTLLNVAALGYTGSGWVGGAGLSFVATENITAANRGTKAVLTAIAAGDSVATTMEFNGSALTINGSTAVTSSNYNTYAPTKTGTGASGTWAINITGNAATATSATDSTKLPLAGGTLTGNVTLDTSDGEILVTPTGWRSSDRAAIKIRSKANAPAEIDLRHTVSGVESGWHISARDTSSASELHFYRFNMNSAGAADSAGSFLQMFTFRADGSFNTAGAITQNGSQVLTAGNYNSYSPTLTGTGASGTWGISISGNSATTSQRAFSGDISATGQGRFTGWYTGNAATGTAAEIGMSSGEGYVFVYNRDTQTYGTLNISSSGANMRFSGSAINVGSGSLQQGGNQVLHAGNYTSYAATSGHNHTYDVNNAWLRDANDDANVKLYGNTRQMVFRTDGTTEFASGIGGYAFAWMYGGDSAAERRMLLASNGRLWTNYHGWMDDAFAPLSHTHSYLPLSGGTLSGSIYFPNDSANGIFNAAGNAGYRPDDVYGNTYMFNQSGTNGGWYGDFSGYYFRSSSSSNWLTISGSAVNSSVALQQSGNQVLHAGNYSSYALPLSGGTLTGAFTVNNAFSTFSKNAASGANEVAKFINSGGGYSSRIYIGANPGADWLIGKDCYGAGNDRFQIGSWNGYAYIDIAYNTTAGTINFPNNGGLTVNSNTILHAGNYSSYALPLSGGTLSGSVTISPSATLSFGNGTRQMINLWSTNYGIGVQSSTTYFRTDSRFSWHRGGSHNDNENNPGGGTVAMTLDSGSNLSVAGGVFPSGVIRAPQITAGGSTNTDANLGVQGSSHFTGTIYYGGSVGNVNSWSSLSTSSSGTHTFSASRFVFDRYGYGSQALITLENGGITLSQPTIITSELTLNASNIWFNSSPSLRSNGNFSFLTNSSAAQAGRFLGVQVSTSYGGSVPSNGILFFTDTALVRNTANELDLDGRRLLHASNYSSYALPLSGGTLSGALSATSGLRSYYSDHIPGNGYGIRFWESNSYKISMGEGSLYQYGTVTDYSIKMQMDNGSPGRGFTWGRESFAPVAALNGTTGSFQTVGAVKSGNNMSRPNASWGSSGATGMAIFKLPGGSGNYGMVHMVFDIYEYNGNSVSTVIVGGHNWAGSWYNIGANVVGQCGKQVRLGFIDGQYCVVFGDGSSYWEYGQVVLRKIQNGEYYNNIMDLGAVFSVVFTASASFSNISGDLRALRTPASFNAGGAITQAGNQVLHAGNYTSYSPSLGGSGASGTWGISITGNAGTLQGYQWASAGKDVRGSQFYVDNWFRNYNSGTGLYNEATSNHFYSDGQYWNVGYSGTTGIRLRNGHAGTILGYLYAETNQNMGLLNSSGNWAVQVYPGGTGGGNLAGTWTGGNLKANRANGNFYIDDNYGNGVVGAYASTRYQGVFAMGDAYKLPADGTSTGGLYGMAWSHPNAGGAAGNLTDHGLLIINNGAFKCAISNSIVASSNITAYSDERLKTNWRDMPEDYVARLAQVKVGIYDRIDEEDVTQVGVSAQSFQKLLPQAIMTAKDEMQTLSVNYGGAALASAVELAKRVVDQEKRIAHLESLINKLIGD
jgi:hypothetical protein